MESPVELGHILLLNILSDLPEKYLDPRLELYMDVGLKIFISNVFTNYLVQVRVRKIIIRVEDLLFVISHHIVQNITILKTRYE